MSDHPTDAEILSDLMVIGFCDPAERYPEYGHTDVIEAWRDGYATASDELQAAKERIAVLQDIVGEKNSQLEDVTSGHTPFACVCNCEAAE